MQTSRLKKTPILVAALVVAAFVGLKYARSSGMIGQGQIAAEPDQAPVAAQPGAMPVQARPSAPASIRLCGSNTVGSELAPALVADFLASRGATGVRREKSGQTETVSGSLPGDPAPFVAEITSAGTGTAFKEMSATRCDIAMASRQVTPQESSLLGDGLSEHVLGLDGIAVIARQDNPVSVLDVPQLARLFSGASSWAEVGGSGQVDVVSFDEKSGTYDTFKKLVLGDSLALSGRARLFSDSEELVRAVSSSPGAVGYTSLSSARGVKILAVADHGMEPVVPTVWTVARESYPLTRRLYLYTHPRFTRPAADSIILFALSDQGQSTVSRLGFTDLAVKAEPPSACRTCPPQYIQSTYGSRRLSVDFRFQNGSSELDSRALADADRVVHFVKPGAQVQFIGFADNSGAPGVNQRLSLERAEKVRSELARRGLTSSTSLGMGSLMPAFSNDTEPGRQRNRRVEVWISGS